MLEGNRLDKNLSRDDPVGQGAPVFTNMLSSHIMFFQQSNHSVSSLTCCVLGQFPSEC